MFLCCRIRLSLFLDSWGRRYRGWWASSEYPFGCVWVFYFEAMKVSFRNKVLYLVITAVFALVPDRRWSLYWSYTDTEAVIKSADVQSVLNGCILLWLNVLLRLWLSFPLKYGPLILFWGICQWITGILNDWGKEVYKTHSLDEHSEPYL